MDECKPLALGTAVGAMLAVLEPDSARAKVLAMAGRCRLTLSNPRLKLQELSA